MMLKEKFLSFVEIHRSANATREVYGVDDPRTAYAYHNLNQRKNEIAESIEEIEKNLDKALKALEGVQSFVKDLEPYADRGHSLVPSLREACDTLLEIKGKTKNETCG